MDDNVNKDDAAINDVAASGAKYVSREHAPDVILRADWQSVSTDGVMQLQPLHCSNYVKFVPSTVGNTQSCALPHNRSVQMSRTNPGLVPDTTERSRSGQDGFCQTAGERKQKKHQPIILKKRSKGTTVSSSSCHVKNSATVPRKDCGSVRADSGISKKGHVKGYLSHRGVRKSIDSICEQLRLESTTVGHSTITETVTGNCHVLNSSWDAVSKPPSWKNIRTSQAKPSTKAKQISSNKRQTHSIVNVATIHSGPLCSTSAADDKTTRGHKCKCLHEQTPAASPAKASASPRVAPVQHNQTKLSTSRDIGSCSSKVVSLSVRKTPKEMQSSIENNTARVVSCDNTSTSTSTTSQCVVKSRSKEVREQSTGMCQEDKCFRDKVGISKYPTTQGGGSSGVDLKDVPLLPKIGCTPFDPMPYTVGKSDRSPFGFFHNDKLFVFVPPSPEKEDPDALGTDSGSRQQGKKGKSQTHASPLNLQSNHLIGTQTLVKRILEKSDKIPIVIVRPKKNNADAMNNLHEQLEEMKSSYVRDKKEKPYDQEASSKPHLKLPGNPIQLHAVDNKPKTVKHKNSQCSGAVLDPTMPEDSEKQAIVQQNDKSTDMDAKTNHNGQKTDLSPNVKLKDCYINMGTRTSLPSSLKLELGEESTSVSPHKETKKSLTPSRHPSSKVQGSQALVKGKPPIIVRPSIIASRTFEVQATTKTSVRRKQSPVDDVKVVQNVKPANPKSQRKYIQQIPGLSSSMTSFLADFLLFENKCKTKKDPITVVLKNAESKTVLTLPAAGLRNLHEPVQLVPRAEIYDTDEINRCRGSQAVTVCSQTGDHHTQNEHKSNKPSIISDCKTPNNKHNPKQLTKNRNEKYHQQEHQRPQTRADSRNHPSEVNKGVLSPRNTVQSFDKKQKRCNKLGTLKSADSRAPTDISPSVLETLQLQRTPRPSVHEITHPQVNAKDLFTGIENIYYAAGAQISTYNGLTTSRRTVFAICFTSRDPFLKPSEGVLGNLPTFLSFNKDHMVSMIFTSRMCSGFFLVQPTGLVKQDPRKPEIYVESAFLMPYSHKLYFPKDALSLVIGPLEEDWNVSLKLANSLAQRTLPKNVIDHFIGLEECRCFSTSLKDLKTELAPVERRELTSVDYEKHRRNVEVMSCRCKDCGFLAQSRRRRRKPSVRLSLSSDDEGQGQDTPADDSSGRSDTCRVNSMPTDSLSHQHICQSEDKLNTCGKDENNRSSITDTTTSEINNCSDTSVKTKGSMDNLKSLLFSKEKCIHRTPCAQSRTRLKAILESDPRKRCTFVQETFTFSRQNVAGSRQTPKVERQAPSLQNSIDNVGTEKHKFVVIKGHHTGPERSTGCHGDGTRIIVVAREMDVAEPSKSLLSQPRKRKGEKMVVKMGFPFKKIPRQSTP